MKLNKNFALAFICTGIWLSLLQYFNIHITFWVICITFIASYPVKIGQDVYSIASGGFNPDGSVYSFFSFWQEAYATAFSVCGFNLYQISNTRNAMMLIGCNWVQISSGTASLCFGFSLFQKSCGKGSVVCIGISILQKSHSCSFIGVGIAGYQTGNEVATLAGIVLIQKSGGEASQLIGITIYTNCEKYNSILFGIGIFTIFSERHSEYHNHVLIFTKQKIPTVTDTV